MGFFLFCRYSLKVLPGTGLNRKALHKLVEVCLVKVSVRSEICEGSQPTHTYVKGNVLQFRELCIYNWDVF